MSKKLLSLLLTVTMMLLFIPALASADYANPGSGTEIVIDYLDPADDADVGDADTDNADDPDDPDDPDDADADADDADAFDADTTADAAGASSPVAGAAKTRSGGENPIVLQGNNTMNRIDYAPGDVMPNEEGIIVWRTDITLTQRAGGPGANVDQRLMFFLTPQGYTGRPDPSWAHADPPIALRAAAGRSVLPAMNRRSLPG